MNAPYFRHKDKADCDRFPEPETEEHSLGKRNLYEWICKQDGVTDTALEGWVPETHQRPDIMFKYNGNQYVIEYQCSPIATEYLERHDLYNVGGIKDIWVLGTENYLNCKNKIDNKVRRIEKDVDIYFDSHNEVFIYSDKSEFSKNQPIYHSTSFVNSLDAVKEFGIGGFNDKRSFNCTSLNSLCFNGNFTMTSSVVNKIELHRDYFKSRILAAGEIISQILFGEVSVDNIAWKEDKAGGLTIFGNSLLRPHYITAIGNSVYINISYGRRIQEVGYTLNIQIGYNSSIISAPTYDEFVNSINERLNTQIVEVINRQIKKESRKAILKKEVEVFEQKITSEIRFACNEYLNIPICLLENNSLPISNNIRFMYLGDYNGDLEFYYKVLPNKLKFLKSKGVSYFAFMLPRRAKYSYVENRLKNAGFNMITYDNLLDLVEK